MNGAFGRNLLDGLEDLVDLQDLSEHNGTLIADPIAESAAPEAAEGGKQAKSPPKPK